MLSNYELNLMNRYAAADITHHRYPFHEARTYLGSYIDKLTSGEDTTHIENVCRRFIKAEQDKVSSSS